MTKPAIRAFSTRTRHAVLLLGDLIRQHRLDSRITAASLAERAGISRALLHRIEQGDPGCGIGVVFEVATILGVKLFDSDTDELAARRTQAAEKLALLPRSARPARQVKDDF